MMDFFGTRKFYRRHGERINEFGTRFDEGLNTLKDDGVDIRGLEPILGWFFLYMARLTPERRERVRPRPRQAGGGASASASTCLNAFPPRHAPP
jgi:hypothetical protein